MHRDFFGNGSALHLRAIPSPTICLSRIVKLGSLEPDVAAGLGLRCDLHYCFGDALISGMRVTHGRFQ